MKIYVIVDILNTWRRLQTEKPYYASTGATILRIKHTRLQNLQSQYKLAVRKGFDITQNREKPWAVLTNYLYRHTTPNRGPKRKYTRKQTTVQQEQPQQKHQTTQTTSNNTTEQYAELDPPSEPSDLTLNNYYLLKAAWEQNEESNNIIEKM